MTVHPVTCWLWEHMPARVSGVEVLSHAVAMSTTARMSIRGLNQSWWTSLVLMARRVAPVCSSVLSEEVQC